MPEGPLEQALDFAPTGIALLTGDAHVRWVNRRLCRMLRRDADDLVGQPLEALTHPDDYTAGDISAENLAIGQMRDHGRIRLLRPDDTSVWGGVAVSRLPDEPTGPAIVAQINDLSALMRAEEQLGMVVQGLDNGIVTYDPRGRVASANHAAARLLGIDEHAIVGEVREPDWVMVDESGAPVELEARPEAAVARTGEPAGGCLGVPLADGTMRWLEVSAHPIERTDERWVVTSYRDVSDRRRVEAELELSMAADRAKSEFLSRMSHELRTPLNVVLGYAQLLQMDDLAPQHRDSVEQILVAGRHLLEMVEDVLDLERIGRGRLEVTLQPVLIRASLHEVVELVQPLADASGVTVDVREAPGDGDGIAIADAKRLRQVLLNLLTNAIKYNRRGGNVAITSHAIAETIVVRVRDTGHGVAPDQLSNIFLPFERLDADALGIDGAGVGLALSKRLVEAMGGRIGVESSVGVGSTFWFVVRAARHDATELLTPTVEPLSDEAAVRLVRETDGPTRRILYIEDNPASRTLLEQLVARRGGFDVVAASTVAEGLRLARGTDPDAVLVDLNLPDGSGEDLVRALRADPRTADVPVIVLSADATAARREALNDLGVLAYLTKPLDAAELFLTLEGAPSAVAG